MATTRTNSSRSGAAAGRVSSSATRGQGRRPGSKVWEFFKKIPDEKGKTIVAECPTCRTRLSARSENGTSHLRRHRCLPEVQAPPPEPPAAAAIASPMLPVAAAAAADEDDKVFSGLEDIVPPRVPLTRHPRAATAKARQGRNLSIK
ncbi:unnamed protein product [Miscanthus lutarioriparius]|uniref:BED-type domain-containing protein n=1 Tax=Miscanthus lutarioriparius TaxID=422564 RepID=A0A811S946_9POAL|nr:unnamed protein product [Miscanthus lutarioriparius]